MKHLRTAMLAVVAAFVFLSGLFGYYYGRPSAGPSHALGAYPASPSFYANERSLGRFWVTDPTYGAKGDCTTDDSAAIMAADAARRANGPGSILRFAPPTGCYKVNSELQVDNAVWQGEFGQTDAGTSTGVVIRAGAAMRSVLHVHNATPAQDANPAQFTDLTIDANGLATYAVDRAGDFKTRYVRVHALNAIKDAWHAEGFRFPMLFSAFSQSIVGGSPSLSLGSFTQPDQGYNGIITAGATQIVLKVNATGALDTATYVESFDNGATFQSTPFLISHIVNVPLESGSLIQFGTGIQVAFPAGTYHAGDTYSVTATVQVEGGQQYAVNADAVLSDCWGKTSGSVFASGGIAGLFSGNVPTIVTGSGTAAVAFAVNGSIVGTGTNWTSAGARTGDMVTLKCGTTVFHMPIGVVADDTHIYSRGLQLNTLSGCDYAIGVGAGFWEDDGIENVRTRYDNGWAQIVPVGTRTTGAAGGGPTLTQVRTTTYAIAAHVVGGIQSPVTSTVFHEPHIESGASTALTGFFLMPGCLGGAIMDPKELSNFEGQGDLQIRAQGRYACQNGNFGSMVPQISDIALNVDYGSVNGDPVVAVPNTRLPDTGNFSTVFVTSSSDHVWAGAVLQRPSGDANGTGANGIKVAILNYGTHAITIPDNSGGSTIHLRQMQSVTLHQYEALHVVSRNDFWQEDDAPLPSVVLPTIARVNHAATPYQIVYPTSKVYVDVTGGVVEIDAPASPVDGLSFAVTNTAGSAATSNITVKDLAGHFVQDPNDITITPIVSSATMSTKGASATWIYDATQGIWWLQ